MNPLKISIVLVYMLAMNPCGYARKIYIQEFHSVVKKDIVSPSVKAGDTLVLKAGKRDWLLFESIQGTQGKPVVIINEGGVAAIAGYTLKNHAVRFSQCNFIKLTGTGSEGIKHGIHITFSQKGTHGISLENFSDHIEIEHIEISGTGFAGIMAKTDRAGKNWTMTSMSFHHNYIHDTEEGEGFYIGHSFWNARNEEHIIDSLSIYNNIIENTAAEGIQVGCTYTGNADIYDNLILNFGKAKATFASNQGNGIQLGNGFSGRVYNNIIQAGPDTVSQNGMNILGAGNIFVFRNIIIGPGKLGIYSGYQTAEEGKPFYFIHNIIIHPGAEGIQYDPRIPLKSFFHYNAVITSERKKIIDIKSGTLDTSNTKIYSTTSGIDKIILKNYKATSPHLDPLLSIQIKLMEKRSMNEKLYTDKKSYLGIKE